MSLLKPSGAKIGIAVLLLIIGMFLTSGQSAMCGPNCHPWYTWILPLIFALPMAITMLIGKYYWNFVMMPIGIVLTIIYDYIIACLLTTYIKIKK